MTVTVAIDSGAGGGGPSIVAARVLRARRPRQAGTSIGHIQVMTTSDGISTTIVGNPDPVEPEFGYEQSE
ncbi:unnamed protein product [Didymodactylos carnosus]|uniref:Uncharacterized protein n=1 Tax=Didymodactylos carnosus TaxID=1234261 RepID=A0A8S2EEL8_9BILA|nr:unnamed protein product [Didymodactylos carnosus]CAF4014864.1 unnamed protein product [Didymodactylos carnosus]